MHHTAFIFDRKRVRQHRRRAARQFAAHDFLHRAAAERLAERLEDITRPFPRVACISDAPNILAEQLHGHPRLGHCVYVGREMVCDEEALPFAENTLDAVLCHGTLHWVNDVPGMLAQLHRCLKPDGMLLALFPGGRTLHELRESFAAADIAEESGVRPHVSPFIDVRDAGSLLQRAGFALPVVDSEVLTLLYADPLALMRELRGMGETNALHAQQRGGLRRTTLARMCAEYSARFAAAEGGIRASVELLAMIGWKPHASQPKPLSRGSGQVSLTDVFSPSASKT